MNNNFLIIKEKCKKTIRIFTREFIVHDDLKNLNITKYINLGH